MFLVNRLLLKAREMLKLVVLAGTSKFDRCTEYEEVRSP